MPGDEAEHSVAASRRGGWVAFAVVVVAIVVVAVVVTRSSAPSGPVAGVAGDLLFVTSEGGTSSRIWIWDLATGAIDRGPAVDAPIELVDSYFADPEGGWVGVISQDDEQQVAGLLRNFAETDVPTPLVRGDLVTWSTGGGRVAAASKPGGACSALRVEELRLQTGAPNGLFDGTVCGRLEAIAITGLDVHAGFADEDDQWVSRIDSEGPQRWLDGAALVSVTDFGGALVVPSCDVPDAPPGTCGGLAYAHPSFDRANRFLTFGEPGDGVLEPERFLGWSRDGRTGYLVGTVGDVRGIYAIAPTREEPGSPSLILETVASEVYLTESTGAGGRNLFVWLDGALVMVRASGGQVPLTLPDDVPAPGGPILWLPSVGGGA